MKLDMLYVPGKIRNEVDRNLKPFNPAHWIVNHDRVLKIPGNFFESHYQKP
jgi:hypothetical protein